MQKDAVGRIDKTGAFCGDAPSTKRFELKLYNAEGVKFLINRRVIRCNGKFVIDRTYVSSNRFSCSCARHGEKNEITNGKRDVSYASPNDPFATIK